MEFVYLHPLIVHLLKSRGETDGKSWRFIRESVETFLTTWGVSEDTVLDDLVTRGFSHDSH